MNIFKNDTYKNVFSLLTGNTIAQILGVLIYPILTRLYSAEDFGVLSLFLTIGGLMTICANAEIHNSILLPSKEEEAKSCFVYGFIVVVFVSILLIPITFFLKDKSLFELDKLDGYAYLLPFFVFISSIWVLFNNVFSRKKMFSKTAEYQVITSVSNASLKTIFGYIKFPFHGLIIGTIISQSLSLIFSFFRSFKEFRNYFQNVDFSLCKYVAKKYKKFPIYSLPRSFVCYFSGNLPILLLSYYFDMKEIGYLSMALTLAFRPINMISTSLYQVFFQKCVEKYNNNDAVKPFIVKFAKQTLLFIIPIFIILFFILPNLTSFILGEEWYQTGLLISYMLPWLAVSAVVAPISFISDIYSAQNKALFFEISILVFRFLGLFIGIYLDNFLYSILFYSLFNALIISLQFFWFLSLMKR